MKKITAALAMVCSVIGLVCVQALPQLGFITFFLTQPNASTAQSLLIAYAVGAFLYLNIFGFDEGLIIIIL